MERTTPGQPRPVFDPATDHVYREAKWERPDRWYVARRRWHDSQSPTVHPSQTGVLPPLSADGLDEILTTIHAQGRLDDHWYRM